MLDCVTRESALPSKSLSLREAIARSRSINFYNNGAESQFSGSSVFHKADRLSSPDLAAVDNGHQVGNYQVPHSLVLVLSQRCLSPVSSIVLHIKVLNELIHRHAVGVFRRCFIQFDDQNDRIQNAFRTNPGNTQR